MRSLLGGASGEPNSMIPALRRDGDPGRGEVGRSLEGFGARESKAITSAAGDRRPHPVLRSQRAQPGTIRQYDCFCLEVDVLAVGHEGIVAPLDRINCCVVKDLRPPGTHTADESSHVIGRGQVMLALDQHPGHHPGGEVRFVLPSLVARKVFDLDVLTAAHYPLDLVHKSRPPGLVGKTGQDVAGGQIRFDPSGALPLVGLGYLFVERAVGGHAATPLAGGAMGRQPGHKRYEPGVAAPQDLDRGTEAQDRPDAVTKYGRLRQRSAQRRRHEPGVLPGGTGAGVHAIDHADLDPVVLKRPGTRQTHDAGPDHENPFGTVVRTHAASIGKINREG